jgi:hypothetical protein
MSHESYASNLVWFRSSFSNGAGGECVECALTSGGVLIRDSKIAEAEAMAVKSAAWASFIQGVKRGGAST